MTTLKYGWIALPRNIVDHWLWDNPRRLQMWLRLVIDAVWTDTCIYYGKTPIEIKRGQLATSTRKLMAKWGCQSEMATSFLKSLEQSQLISRQFMGHLTIISINDYDSYQPLIDSIDTQNEGKNTPMPKQLSKQEKEYKENNKYISSLSRDKEIQFYNSACNDDDCLQSLSIVLNAQAETIINDMHVFLNEVLLRKNYHKSFEDFVNHFRNWHSKKTAKATQFQNDNEIRHDARRGTEISNRPSDRYKNESF